MELSELMFYLSDFVPCIFDYEQLYLRYVDPHLWAYE